jgi:hypothetical protein
MKYRVADLEGALLDAAVALAEGDALPNFWRDPEDGTCWSRPGREEWKPSERWDQGGPIIERERITVTLDDADGLQWFASVGAWMCHDLVVGEFSATGATPLIAAMRAYVASRFGEEAEIP